MVWYIGGGDTNKILHFENLHIIKEQFIPSASFFTLIQEQIRNRLEKKCIRFFNCRTPYGNIRS
jgi:hypothetical protein